MGTKLGASLPPNRGRSSAELPQASARIGASLTPFGIARPPRRATDAPTQDPFDKNSYGKRNKGLFTVNPYRKLRKQLYSLPIS
jgi:hypothetical protein